MTVIDNLSDYSNQLTTLILPDGTTADLSLVYNGSTQRWVWGLVYGTRVITDQGLCALPNILRQWKNLLPFGISCVSATQTDPIYQTDFATNRVQLYLLTAADVIAIERLVYGSPI